MPDTELAEELLQIEEADAWFEYLEATRGQARTATARSSRGPGRGSPSGCARFAPGAHGYGPPRPERAGTPAARPGCDRRAVAGGSAS